MVCTPIFINSFVVFVRLYWFERRFQNVVRDAKQFRHTRTRTMTEPKDEVRDRDQVEKGVRGQSIVVMHNGVLSHHPYDEKNKVETGEESTSGSSSEQGGKDGNGEALPTKPVQRGPTFRREITFADEVKGPQDADKDIPIMPQQLSPEQHIAFLENQRNPKDKGALRIPGPRDFERGIEPKQLEEGEGDEGADLEHETSAPLHQRKNSKPDEPDQLRLRIDTSASNRLSVKRRTSHSGSVGPTPGEEATPATGRFLKARTGTFSSIRNWASAENEPVTPYLSWQPTVGRNSAFVDLTEEQREELGGIEYRSLKTLAVVLVRELRKKESNSIDPALSDFQPSLLRWLAPCWNHNPVALDCGYGHLGKDR